MEIKDKNKELEKEFSKYVGVSHAVCVSNCTAALHLALLAIGVKKGDEVIAIEVETGKNKPEQTQKNFEKLLKLSATIKFIIATNDTALIKTKDLVSGLDFPDKGSIEIINI